MADESPKKYKADVYRFSRSLNSTESEKSCSVGITKSLEPFKHWGAVVEYLDEDEDEGLPEKYLYHATMDARKLQVTSEKFTPKFLKMTGAKKELIGQFLVSKVEVEAFCQDFNSRNEDYVAVKNNCQVFVEELLFHLGISSCYLPPTAKTITRGLFAGSKLISASIINSSGWAVAKNTLIQNLKNPELAKKLFSEAFAWTSTQCSFLGCEGIQNIMKETGKQFSLSASGEILEGWLSACKGAFTPWQLLQIPVELVTKRLFENYAFQNYSKEEREAFAYGLSKVTSLTTAACVGFIAGPLGVLGGVAFWFAAEIGSYLIRKALEMTGNWVVDTFGESPNEKLFRVIFKSLLPRMIDYLNNFAKPHLQ